jgi:YebC/PmpR family DNA-binding regulatory protein
MDGDMSGHSKWATTHRQKEVKDAKRGAVFTKMAAQIAVAVREGGGVGDPEQNFHLRLVVDKAREYNMPKENITRAIEKGLGAGQGEGLNSVVYEGFGPGGVGVVVETVTDNKARTAQQVRSVLENANGSMGVSGSVSHQFSRKGELILESDPKNTEKIELEAIDLGAEDFEIEDEALIIYCEKEKFLNLKSGLEKLGYQIKQSELILKPQVMMEITDPEMRTRVEGMIERLEELDDVVKVWTNYA